MTILLSYSEIQSTARNAARGAGLPYGIAEEIGHAAVWLAGRRVDAVSAVVGALADVKGRVAIVEGLAAIDALRADRAGRIALDRDDVALLLVGLAGAATAERGVAFALDRGDGDFLPLARVDDARMSITKPTWLCVIGETDETGRLTGTPRPAAGDAAAYARAMALATRTCVPASDLSRAQGAGAGTSDND